MGVREYANNNPAVITGGAVFILVVCLGVIACQLFGGGGGGNSSNVKLVYYDISNNTISFVPAQDRPLSPLADNANAYRAVIMSCGECGELTEGMTNAEIDAAGMFVAYIQQLPSGDGAGADRMLEQNINIADVRAGQVTDNSWFSQNSEYGLNYMTQIMDCPGDVRARQCQP